VRAFGLRCRRYRGLARTPGRTHEIRSLNLGGLTG
jgi:hypothetical protein